MGLTAILSFVGCSGNKSNSEIEALEYRVSGYNPGYDIRLEKGKIIYENFDEGQKHKIKADEKNVSELMSIFKELDIYSWDGFDEVDEEVLDGMGFNLYVKFADGSCIKASGDNKFPVNFQKFDEAFRSLFE